MSVWSAIINTILINGSYPNYGNQPTTIILYSGSIRVRGTYIILEDSGEEPTSDHKGKVLMKYKTGVLSIFTTNEIDRDALELDVHAILSAQTTYSFEIIDEAPSIPQENIYKYEITIKVLD